MCGSKLTEIIDELHGLARCNSDPIEVHRMVTRGGVVAVFAGQIALVEPVSIVKE